MRYSFFLALSLLLTNVAYPAQLEPSFDNCDFYFNLEMNKQCGDKGYPIGYGYKYCDKFSNVCSQWLTSPDAVKWLRGTKYCLQKSLMAPQVKTMSCDDLADFAFDSHPYCYTSGSVLYGGVNFCLLDVNDVFDISSCIDDEDLFSDRSMRQIEEISYMCIDLLLESSNTTYPNGNVLADTETALKLSSIPESDLTQKINDFFLLLDKLKK